MFDRTKDMIYYATHYVCEMLTHDLDCKVCACGRGIVFGLLVGGGVCGLIAMLMLGR